MQKKTKAKFSCLLQPPAWKQSMPYSTAPGAHTGQGNH